MTRWTALTDRPDAFRAEYGTLEVQQNLASNLLLRDDGTFKTDFLYFETQNFSDTLDYADAASLYEFLGEVLEVAEDAKEEWERSQRTAQVEANTEKFNNAGLGTVIQRTNDGLGNFIGKVYINVGPGLWVSAVDHTFVPSADFLASGLLKNYEFIKD